MYFFMILHESIEKKYENVFIVIFCYFDELRGVQGTEEKGSSCVPHNKEVGDIESYRGIIRLEVHGSTRNDHLWDLRI